MERRVVLAHQSDRDILTEKRGTRVALKMRRQLASARVEHRAGRPRPSVGTSERRSHASPAGAAVTRANSLVMRRLARADSAHASITIDSHRAQHEPPLRERIFEWKSCECVSASLHRVERPVSVDHVRRHHVVLSRQGKESLPPGSPMSSSSRRRVAASLGVPRHEKPCCPILPRTKGSTHDRPQRAPDG